MNQIEKVWPQWHVDKPIGRGSYGTVYKCYREVNNKTEYCAIKVISIPQDDIELTSIHHEGMTDDQTRQYFEEIISDFENEIKLLELLKGHDNIVKIYDSKIIENESSIGWTIFIRMELLTDLNTYLSDKRLSENEVIKFSLDLCNALAVCQEHKIIHRDIKPENIFVDSNGNFKLGDFGVAKQLERTNESLSRKGAFNYMAPEILSARHYDSRADIYSLGIVMYKLLNNNRLPFLDPDKQIIKHSERQQAFEKRVSGEKIPPIKNISDELNSIILKACRYNAEDRFKNVNELVKALNSLNSSSHIKFKFMNSFTSKSKKALAISLVVLIAVTSISIGVYSSLDKKPITSENTANIVSSASTIPPTEKEEPSSVAAITSEADTTKKAEEVIENKEYLINKLQSMNIENSNQRYGIFTYNNIDFCPGYIDGAFYAVSEKVELKLSDQNCAADFSIIDSKIYYSVIKNIQRKYLDTFDLNYDAAQCECWMMDLDGSNKKKLFDFNGSGCVLYADSNNIYYESDAVLTFTTYSTGRNLYRYSLNDKESYLINNDSSLGYDMGVSNRTYYNNHIYFNYIDDVSQNYLYDYDINSKRVKRLGFKAYYDPDSIYELHSGICFSKEGEMYIKTYDVGREVLSKYNPETQALEEVTDFEYFEIRKSDYYDFLIKSEYTVSEDEKAHTYYGMSDGSLIELENLEFVNYNGHEALINHLSQSSFVYAYWYNNDGYPTDKIFVEKSDGKSIYTLAEIDDSSILGIGHNRFCGRVVTTENNYGVLKFYDLTKVIDVKNPNEVFFGYYDEDDILTAYGPPYYSDDTGVVVCYASDCVVIDSKGSLTDKFLNIPAKIDNQSVKGIKDYGLSTCGNIERLILPDSIEKIGVYALSYCTNMESVKLPSNIDTIPAGMFMSCNSLSDITIPESVSTIERQAFSNCKSLKKLTLSNNLSLIEENAFSSCSDLELYIINPDCKIEGSYTSSEIKTIYGIIGSKAQSFAEENNIPFVNIQSLTNWRAW